jgi:hypothetical protein
VQNTDAHIIKLINWLVNEFDIKEMGIDYKNSLCQLAEFKNLYQRSKSKILLVRGISEIHDEPYTPLGRISILEKNASPSLLNEVMKLERPIHILI